MAQANPLFPVNCEFPVLEKDLKAEVTVIGAGIAGMSSAYHLANKGYDVIVLEEQQIGSGATSASSGILYYGSGTELTKAISLFGKEKARLLWEESRKTIESVVDLIQKNSIECHFRNPGAIIAAKNKEEQLFLEKELENLNGIGFEGKILPGSEIKNHFSKREFSSGLLQDAVVQIAPALFTAGLADASNLKVYSSSPLLSYTEADGFITVQTPKAKIKTEKILFATNRKPFFGLESYFFIENSVILASKKMSSEQIRKIWPEHKILWTMEEKYDIIYEHDSRAILEIYYLKGAKEKLDYYYPETGFVKEHIWGDSWSKTNDWLPIIGKIKENVFASIAMGDQGIVMGFTAGRNAFDMVEGRKNKFLDLVSPERF